ncbi:MAG: TonB-dependent receptor plug domain-containing protein, partial [Steroidobacterales bacterium]
SDAIGGVVNILTRGARADGLEIYGGGGRYDSLTASLSGGLQGDRGGLGFSASLLESDGFPTLSDSVDDRGYKNLSMSLQGRWLAGPLELRASAWHANGNTQYTNFSAEPVDSDYQDDSAAIDGAFAVRDGWRMSLRGTLMKNDIDQSESDDFDHTRRYALEWQNDLAIGSVQQLTFGAMASREHTESLSGSAIGFPTAFDADTDVSTAFVEDRLELGRNHLLLAGGYTHHETAGSHGTWNVDYGFDLTQTLRFTAAAGTAFRAPDSTDRFGFGGNPDLDPETSRNFEAGLQWRPAQNQRVTLSAFRDDIRNLIVFVVTDPVTFDGQNENVERARIDGVEASWRLSGASWRLQVAASLQDPRNLTEDSRLLRRTRESYTFSFVKSFNRFQLGTDVLYAGERKDFGFPSAVTLGGYTLVNLTGRVQVTPSFDLDARLENAFDKRYELASGYNTPRRSFFVGARYRFGGK